VIGYGDELLAAGQAQRLYETEHAPVLIVGLDGRPRWHEIWDGNPAILHPDRIELGQLHLVVQSGPNCRPYIVYPFSEDTGWTFNQTFRARDHLAKIYLTIVERHLGELLRMRGGPYVLIEPFTKHNNLRWPLDRWQQLVWDCPDVAFIQHTHAHSPHLRNVTCIQATFREACGLAAASSCYIRSESGMCHAAAALGVPQVTIWGDCLDWEVLGGYPKQTGMVAQPHSPCGRWHPCDHCARALSAITVDAVVTALRRQLYFAETA